MWTRLSSVANENSLWITALTLSNGESIDSIFVHFVTMSVVFLPIGNFLLAFSYFVYDAVNPTVILFPFAKVR
jgi:hypothetical protein